MPNWSRGGRFYGASERSSRAISGRIALIQLYFYGTAAASILVSGGLFGMPLDVWQILDPSALSLFSSHGICAVFATAVAYGSATVCMPSVVQRAKLVADYAFTVFAIHLLLCSVCAVSLGARASRGCAWRHASQGGCQGALAHHAFRATGVGRWSRALLHGALWVRLSLLIAEWLGEGSRGSPAPSALAPSGRSRRVRAGVPRFMAMVGGERCWRVVRGRGRRAALPRRGNERHRRGTRCRRPPRPAGRPGAAGLRAVGGGASRQAGAEASARRRAAGHRRGGRSLGPVPRRSGPGRRGQRARGVVSCSRGRRVA